MYDRTTGSKASTKYNHKEPLPLPPFPRHLASASPHPWKRDSFQCQTFFKACRGLTTETNASCNVHTIPSHESCAKICKTSLGFCSSICFSRGCSGSWDSITSDIVMVIILESCFSSLVLVGPHLKNKKVLWRLAAATTTTTTTTQPRHHHQQHQQQQQQPQQQQQQQQHHRQTHTLFPSTAGGCVSSWINTCKYV